jgi:hypothetical protein
MPGFSLENHAAYFSEITLGTKVQPLGILKGSYTVPYYSVFQVNKAYSSILVSKLNPVYISSSFRCFINYIRRTLSNSPKNSKFYRFLQNFRENHVLVFVGKIFAITLLTYFCKNLLYNSRIFVYFRTFVEVIFAKMDFEKIRKRNFSFQL